MVRYKVKYYLHHYENNLCAIRDQDGILYKDALATRGVSITPIEPHLYDFIRNIYGTESPGHYLETNYYYVTIWPQII